MPLLSPGMLAAARTVANRGLESLALIERPTQTETDFGSTESWATVASDVPCWIRGTSVPTNVGEAARHLVTIGTFRIHFEFGTDVRSGDRLTIEDAQFLVSDTNAENTIQVFTTAMARRVE